MYEYLITKQVFLISVFQFVKCEETCTGVQFLGSHRYLFKNRKKNNRGGWIGAGVAGRLSTPPTTIEREGWCFLYIHETLIQDLGETPITTGFWNMKPSDIQDSWAVLEIVNGKLNWIWKAFGLEHLNIKQAFF